MPRVEIPGVGVVNFPDTMPRDEIMSRAEAMQSNASAPLLNPKDLPASELLKGGFSRGIEGIKGTALDLIPALAGSMFGQKDYAKEQMQEYRDRMAAEEAINPTAYKGFKDIQGIGDFGGFVAETAGELAPDIASFLLGTGVGTTVGKTLAKKSAQQAIEKRAAGLVAKQGLEGEAAKEATDALTSRAISMGVKQNAAAQGAKIGSTVGLFGTSMGQSIPETLNSIYEETGDLAPGLAITFGSLKGALDTYLPSKILKQLGPAGKDRVAAAMLEKSAVVPTTWKKAFIGEALKTTGGEALTESAQQALDVLAGQVAGSKDKFFSQKNIDEILFAGLKGAVGGGTFGAPGAAMEASRLKQAAAQEMAQRQALQQQEAEKQRQEKEQADQQELARQQTATGDLFGQEVPQGPGIPSTTVAEQELAASPMEQKVQELFQEYLNTTSPVAKAAIEKEIKRLDAEGKLSKTSHERQMLLDFLGPMLGYNPNVPSSRTATADNAPIAVNRQGVAVTPDQRALGELVKYSQEEARFRQAATPVKETDLGDTQDMFATEKGIMQSEQLAGIPNQPPSVDQALAGPAQALAEFKTVIDAASLQGTGLKAQSGFYKKLLNKDLANPEDQAAVRDILVQVRQNPNIADSTKQAIESIAMQAFAALGQQANMVGPRGGIRGDINYGRVQPRPADQAGGAGVSVPVQQVPDVTEGVGTPEQPGLEPAGSVTSDVGSREAVQPDTLTEEVPSEPTAEVIEPAVTPEVVEPAVQAPVAEQVAEEVAPPAPKATLSKQERDYLQDHILNLKAERVFVKDPEARAAIDEEIANTEADLKAGKYQFGEGAALFKGDINKLAKDLRSALDKMGLGSIGVKLEKALTTAEGKAAQGVYANKVIEIALNATDAIHTLNHEALHAMREMGLFSPADWNILSNMARSNWVNKYDIEARYPNLTKEEQLEEAVAEAFADFQKQSPRAQSIMEKVLTTLRKIGNWIKGSGYRDTGTVFSEAATGQLVKNHAEVLARFDKYLDSTNKDPRYQVAAAEEVWGGVDKMIQGIPVFNSSQKATLSNAVDRTGDVISAGYLSVMPMHTLGMEADTVFSGLGTEVNTLINGRSGLQDKLSEGIDGVEALIKTAIKKDPQQKQDFSDVAHDSTIAEVDPTKPESTYKGKFDEDGNSKEAAWKDLNARYVKLDKVWQNVYVAIRDAYAKMYQEIKNAINERIDGTDLDAATKISVKADIMKKLAEKGMIEPYFALGREGDKWLAYDYKDKNGQLQRANQAFKSEFARKERMDELQKLGVKYDIYEGLDKVNYRDAPTGSFVNSVLNILETNKPKDDAAAKRFDKATDEMMRLFISTLPETAFAKSFQRRGNKAGYMEDAIKVFDSKVRGMAHQIANMKYNPKINNVIDTMEKIAIQTGKGVEKGKVDALGKIAKETIPARNNETEVKYLEEYKKRKSYVLNPTKNDLGNILTSVAFNYTLGFNVSSPIVNAANIPMIVAPYLKAHYPEAQVARAIGDATKLFMGGGTKIELPILGSKNTATGRAMPSIANYTADSKIGKQFATAIKIWKQNGQLNRSQLYEMLSGDTKTGFLAKLNIASGWMMRHGERMNREVTLVSTYNLEMERLKKPTKEDVAKIEAIQQELNAKREEGTPEVTVKEATETYAAHKAIATADLLNGGTAAAAAPRIAQSSLGKVMFMYKRYGISMYFMLLKAAREAYKGETPEIRKAAMRQIGGIMGMSALMAGAQGIPMYGAVSLLWSLFCDEDDEDLDTVTQKAFGDFLYKGPVDYMTNLAIAGRITLNDLIIRDAPKGSATTFTQQMLQAVGGPVIGVSDRIQRGYSKIAEGHTLRGVEELLPSFAGNAFKGARYLTNGTTTLRGDPITGDVSIYNAVAQMLGFAPADYQRQLEINSREKGIDTFLSKKISKLKQKYYMAKREGDTEGMDDFKNDLLEIGEKHPALAINSGTVEGVLKASVKAQDRATKEMINGVRYNKKRIKEVLESKAEYGDQ
jgi:hypothetical protein